MALHFSDHPCLLFEDWNPGSAPDLLTSATQAAGSFEELLLVMESEDDFTAAFPLSDLPSLNGQPPLDPHSKEEDWCHLTPSPPPEPSSSSLLAQTQPFEEFLESLLPEGTATDPPGSSHRGRPSCSLRASPAGKSHCQDSGPSYSVPDLSPPCGAFAWFDCTSIHPQKEASGMLPHHRPLPASLGLGPCVPSDAQPGGSPDLLPPGTPDLLPRGSPDLLPRGSPDLLPRGTPCHGGCQDYKNAFLAESALPFKRRKPGPSGHADDRPIPAGTCATYAPGPTADSSSCKPAVARAEQRLPDVTNPEQPRGVAGHVAHLVSKAGGSVGGQHPPRGLAIFAPVADSCDGTKSMAQARVKQGQDPTGYCAEGTKRRGLSAHGRPVPGKNNARAQQERQRRSQIKTELLRLRRALRLECTEEDGTDMLSVLGASCEFIERFQGKNA